MDVEAGRCIAWCVAIIACCQVVMTLAVVLNITNINRRLEEVARHLSSIAVSMMIVADDIRDKDDNGI